jgi:hypothetical protein
LPVKVTFSQKDMGGSTKFTAEMDKGDNDAEISEIKFCKSKDGADCYTETITSISEGSN